MRRTARHSATAGTPQPTIRSISNRVFRVPSCAEVQKRHSVTPLFATLAHSLSRKSFPCRSYANTRDRGATPPKFFSFTQTVRERPRVLTRFKINTCKTVSKQTTLTSFRINTYEKPGGEGRLLLTSQELVSLFRLSKLPSCSPFVFRSYKSRFSARLCPGRATT